ncbi:MAG: MBL fold metallo-hydrolase [Planctomycetota bacterium]|jgi:hypothetical protein
MVPGRVIYQQVNKDHAYWIEKRRVGQKRGGNTAGLLTHFSEDGSVAANILFDAGLGTIEGLADLSEFNWQWPLEVFLTHGNIDHHAELMVLSELEIVKKVHFHGFGEGGTLEPVAISPREAPARGIFRIHALDVDHFPGSVIYVAEFSRHRIVIGWDLKTLPDPDRLPVLKRPSLALVAANTWSALSPRAGHTSVEELVSSGFLHKLEAPAGTDGHHGIYLVHYGGGEDPGGAMSDRRLAARFRAAYPDLADTVGVAARGQAWAFGL